VRGFAVLELLDGAVHLEQLSVHPAHGRQGIGAARVTLLTYADVPWNAPFYARHGWRPDPSPTRALLALREQETALGLDRHGPRVVMTRSTR
jgi:hypothetical protein